MNVQSKSDGPAMAAAVEFEAEFVQNLKKIFEEMIVFNRVLGLKILSVKPGDVRAQFAMRPELVGHYAYGRLHGGVIATVLDTVGGLAVTVAVAEKFNNETTEQVGHRFGRIVTRQL